MKGIINSIFLILSAIIVSVYSNQYPITSITADNVCTFHIADKLFSLIYLQHNNFYTINVDDDQKILFNFCHSFIPNECKVGN